MKSMFFAACAAGLLMPAALLGSAAAAQQALIAIDAPLVETMVGTQWVQADADGKVSGTVVLAGGTGSVAEGMVRLVRPGFISASAEVSANGTFQIADLNPGVYTLVYQSESSFAAFALHVVSANSQVALPTSVVVSASNLRPNRALTTIARYQPVSGGDEPQIAAVETLPLPSTPMKAAAYRVTQNSSGGLNGRFLLAGSAEGAIRPAANVNVMIIRDEEVVAQSVTGNEGTFEIANLAPGSYSLLASGRGGFAVIGFELVPPGTPVAASRAVDGDGALVSLTVQDQGGLEVVLAPASPDVMGMGGSEPTNEDESGAIVMDPMGTPGAGGGFGGGGFGGGGGGGAFGGGGALGLAAIGGVIAAVIASDDDDSPRPSSPAIP